MKRLAIACAVAGVFVAFVAAAAPSTRAYRFSHAEHNARDPASTCVDCHDLKAAAQTSGAPSLKTAHCSQCHDDDVPVVAPRAPVVAVPGARATFGVRFDHHAHDGKIDAACTQCHTREPTAAAAAPSPTRTATSAEWALTPSSTRCFACHERDAKAPQARACETCHARDERAHAPATHASSLPWRRSHGTSVVAFAPTTHGASSCTLCHRESSCTSCHRVERPADHGPVWGERLHGISASFDSARCKTCHETGQCISCHRTTEPKNHVGAWKSTHGLVARNQTDATCQACHRPSFCIDCHRGRP